MPRETIAQSVFRLKNPCPFLLESVAANLPKSQRTVELMSKLKSLKKEAQNDKLLKLQIRHKVENSIIQILEKNKDGIQRAHILAILYLEFPEIGKQKTMELLNGYLVKMIRISKITRIKRVEESKTFTRCFLYFSNF